MAKSILLDDLPVEEQLDILLQQTDVVDKLIAENPKEYSLDGILKRNGADEFTIQKAKVFSKIKEQTNKKNCRLV